MDIKLEVIAFSKKDAIAIQQAGADRIELVSDLDKGGLTPPLSIVKEVINSVTIPVRVMVRNTYDSFNYDEKTMDEHIKYIKELSKLKKVDGIVFGSLTYCNNKINELDLQKVIAAKGSMKLTFHRAFDTIATKQALNAFDVLCQYDVDSLLTSGKEENPLLGAKLIKKLVKKNKINIIVGKSIDASNVAKIIKKTKANYIHIGYAARTSDKKEICVDNIYKIIKEIKNV